MDRFNRLDWSIQVQRIKALTDRYNTSEAPKTPQNTATHKELERAKGLEPSTFSLGSWCRRVASSRLLSVPVASCRLQSTRGGTTGDDWKRPGATTGVRRKRHPEPNAMSCTRWPRRMTAGSPGVHRNPALARRDVRARCPRGILARRELQRSRSRARRSPPKCPVTLAGQIARTCYS